MNKKELSILDEVLKTLVQLEKQCNIQAQQMSVYDDCYKLHGYLYNKQNELYKAQEDVINRLYEEIDRYRKEIKALTHFNNLLSKN